MMAVLLGLPEMSGGSVRREKLPNRNEIGWRCINEGGTRKGRAGSVTDIFQAQFVRY